MGFKRSPKSFHWMILVGALFVCWSVHAETTGGASSVPVVEPVGEEFQVNSYTTGDQRQPSVSGNEDGFAVTWRTTYYPPNGYCGEACGAVVRWFSPEAVPATDEVHYDGWPTNEMLKPNVFLQSDGDVTLVTGYRFYDGDFWWYKPTSYHCEGTTAICDYGSWLFGSAEDSYYRVHTRVAGLTSFTSSADTTVAVWADMDNLVGRVILANGSYDGGIFPLNDAHADAFDVAVNWSGDFMVVWEGTDSDQAGIWGRLFNADGTPLQDAVLVNVVESGNQSSPAISCNALGDFVVVWRSETSTSAAIHARRFWANGEPRQGDALVVSSQSIQLGAQADVVYDNIERRGIIRGGFLVVWAGADGDGLGVFGQLVLDSGVTRGPAFRINTHTSGNQTAPQVTIVKNNDFVVVWEDHSGLDGGQYGVFGQRLTGPLFVDGFETAGSLYWSALELAPNPR